MPSFAMKVYDLQWFTTFGMGYEQAAQALVDDGIDTVLTQNRIDPLPHSGVDQTAYVTAFRERLDEYDDSAWMDALRRHGLRVLQTSAVLFNPEALDRFSDARPVNALGDVSTQFDWYVGICPTHDAYLEEKLGLLRRVDRELSPDGMFLQFMRYPGFWENWTWNPTYRFSNDDRFCFCDRCRGRFSEAMHVNLRPGTLASQAQEILTDFPDAWNSWRIRTVADIVTRARETIERGSRSIMLNTLPFPSADFEGLDVRAEFAAQDLKTLSTLVDRFELMTYLQILNRPLSWLEQSIQDARSLLPPEQEIVCTLQVDQLYTRGIHAARNRAPLVSAEDINRAARTALCAGSDGIVFYHWTDFLVDEAAGGSKRRVLRELTNG